MQKIRSGSDGDKSSDHGGSQVTHEEGHAVLGREEGGVKHLENSLLSGLSGLTYKYYFKYICYKLYFSIIRYT